MRRGGYREKEGVRRRAQAGANAWRAVEVVMTDRRIFKRLKVMSTLCDTGSDSTPACLYKKGTLAMNELQQQKLQVYGNNNWVRNIARLTRRAAELREEGRMTRWRPMLRWEACKLGEM